jgi:hypothetical protein
MMRWAIRALRALLGNRNGIAVLGFGALVVLAAFLGGTDHTGISPKVDAVTAPTLMVHADRPACSGKRCAWTVSADLP